MKYIYAVLSVFLFCSLLFFGCAGAPAPQEEESAPSRDIPEKEIKENLEEVEEEEKEEPEAREPEEKEEEPEDAGEEEDFVVTEEVYTKTFDEVEKIINELNEIISNRNFEEWKEYLTEDYREKYSDKETLKMISKQPIMKRNSITVNSLKDYFYFVVVPSRSNARLDELEFVDPDTVKAIMKVHDQRIILYKLVKIDGEWKIGVL